MATIVYVSSEPSGSTTPDPPLAAALSAAPTATAAPTTTAVPTAILGTHRNPNQTCDDEALDTLEAEKKRLCYIGYAADCGSSVSEKTKERTPCSASILSLQ